MNEIREVNRRQFIKTTAAGAMAGLALPSVLRAQDAAAPAIVSGTNLNSRVGIGIIGCGGRANAHINMLRDVKNAGVPIEFVAVCDAYRPRMDQAQKRVSAAHADMDYRNLLARKEVDIVLIATPDHLHGQQAMDALKAGKHVYCEKPVTHWRQFEVTKKLAQVAAESACAFQLGTQAMSDSAWHQMKKLVQEGFIGQPLFGEAGFFRIGDWGERGMKVDDPNAKPGKDLDWDAFQGDAPKTDHTVDRQFRWRLFEDYAGGPVTDLYPHCLTQVVDILGVGFPSEVVAVGGTHRYANELRSVPDTFNLIAQYPEKVTISCLGSQANDWTTTVPRGAGGRTPVIRGWEGSLWIDQNNKDIVFYPVREGGKRASQRIPIERGEDNVLHWRNLIECAQKGTKDTWSPMDLGFRTQTMLHMAMLAMRAGKTARFDVDKLRIVI